MTFNVQLEQKESLEPGKRVNDKLYAMDPWFSAIKNVVWVAGLIVVGAVKFSHLEEVNTAQSVEMARIDKELREKLDSSDARFKEMSIKLQSIEARQIEQLVILTELRTKDMKNGR